MDLTSLTRRAGVGGMLGGYIGYNAGPLIGLVWPVPPELAPNVTNIVMALGLVLGGLVGHWFTRQGIQLLDPEPGAAG